MFTTSDIGWVVGHSYIVYGPLIAGMTTIVYEGMPIRPDAGIWWKIVQDHKVTVMFSAPTAIRVLKKQDPAFLTKYDLSLARAPVPRRRAARRADARWISEALGKPVIDHYWQTETGWPILTARARASRRRRSSSAARASRRTATTCSCCAKPTGKPSGGRREGRGAIVPPLPPGCMIDGVGRRRALRQDLLQRLQGPSRCTRPSTGASATRTATTSSSAAPTT